MDKKYESIRTPGFGVGDQVEIKDKGCTYSASSTAFKDLGFKNTSINPSSPNGTKGFIFDIIKMNGRPVVALNLDNGRQCLICSRGVEKVEKKDGLTKKDLIVGNYYFSEYKDVDGKKYCRLFKYKSTYSPAIQLFNNTFKSERISSLVPKTTFRPATASEMAWLDKCIKYNKYVEVDYEERKYPTVSSKTYTIGQKVRIRNSGLVWTRFTNAFKDLGFRNTTQNNCGDKAIGTIFDIIKAFGHTLLALNLDNGGQVLIHENACDGLGNIDIDYTYSKLDPEEIWPLLEFEKSTRKEVIYDPKTFLPINEPNEVVSNPQPTMNLRRRNKSKSRLKVSSEPQIVTNINK